MDKIGPIEVSRYTCTGCIFLEATRWRSIEDNGSNAICKKIDKDITSYWICGDETPVWCPFLTGKL